MNYGYFFSDTKILEEYQSPYQKIIILETERFGKILNIDGLNNHSEEDGYVYDEMITHVPLCAHPGPESVLVIGGGDCCTNREIVRHASVKKIVMVELDEAVIHLHKKHIGIGLYEDPKLTIHIGDGAEFVYNTDEKFDVIIMDSTDGPCEEIAAPASTPLYTEKFFEACFHRLHDDGIFVTQSDGHGAEYRSVGRNNFRMLGKFFPETYNYLACIPCLYPGFMVFTIASKTYNPRIPARTPDFETDYYSPDIHQAAFVLPPSMKRYLGIQGKNDGTQ